MNTKRAYITTGTLALLAACAGALAEDKSGAAFDEKNRASTTNDVAKAESAAAKSAKPWGFEGSELHMGNLPPVTFHGFASQGLISSTEYNYLGKSKNGLGSPEFSEFGLNATMSPFSRTRISAQAFAFSMGNVGNYEPGLDYALVDYTFSDAVGLRGGRIRRPFGIYNHIQDIDLARTSVLLPQGLYDARWRDFSASVDGGSVYGNINLSKAGSLSYEAYAGMINLSQEGGVSRWVQNFLPQSPVGAFGSVEDSLLYGAQVWWNTPIDGLRAGAALAQSQGMAYNYRVNPPFGPGAMRTEVDTPLQQYSLEYMWKSWTFQAEYQTMNNISQNSAMGAVVSRDRVRQDAWYLGASYRFNKWFETGAYYTEYYNNVEDRDGSNRTPSSDGYQKDLALSLRFDPKPWWIIKLEGHTLHGTGLLRDRSLNPVRDGNDWYMLALKTTFSF